MSSQDVTGVPQLPWYQTLREFLEPYAPAASDAEADKYLSSPEIIAAIELHHGNPQGLQQGLAVNFVEPADFVRAMRYLGYRSTNSGNGQLQWLLKKL